MREALEDTGIKLDCVASNILGKSGRAMLDALVGGTSDPEILAELAEGKLRAKIPALREALERRFEPHHALVMVAEIGTDMSRFPSPGHLASWGGRCPGQRSNRRQAPLRPHPQGLQVAADRARRSRARAQLEALGHKVTLETLPQAASPQPLP